MRDVVLVVALAVGYVGAASLMAAFLTLVALALPARRGGRLRAALASAGPLPSRGDVLAAWSCWRRAYLATAHGIRKAQALVGTATVPVTFASARWQSRTLLLTAPGVCLRVVQRRDGGWRLADVAGWPVGSGRARPLLESVCAAADAAKVTITLRASTAKVASAVYAPLGFAYAGGLRMVRRPREIPLFIQATQQCPINTGPGGSGRYPPGPSAAAAMRAAASIGGPNA